jgi:hypothetical protein
MNRFYTTLLGTYQDRDYYLTVLGEPSINNIEEFAVTIHYDDPQTRETVEIAHNIWCAVCQRAELDAISCLDLPPAPACSFSNRLCDRPIENFGCRADLLGK